MANNYFSFKQFTINQDKSAFKVGTDGVLLGAVADISAARHILDIGSGTGLIPIMLAQRCNAEIVALEPDHESYCQCLENVSLCRWKDRIKVGNVKLQDYSDHPRFDLVVTNPPYFTDSMKNPDPRKSSARHNDSLTNDELLKGALKLLSAKGRLQIIMPYAEGNVLIAEAAGYGLFCNNILKIRPMPASDIRRLIMTFTRHSLRPTEKILTIEYGRRHEFTEEYKDLTREFYLKF